jgi:hypothetical protein
MTADRHELHDLVDELPDDQVELAIADVRRRLAKPKSTGSWPPELFGVIDGTEVPTNVARDADEFLAPTGFGRDSL